MHEDDWPQPERSRWISRRCLLAVAGSVAAGSVAAGVSLLGTGSGDGAADGTAAPGARSGPHRNLLPQVRMAKTTSVGRGVERTSFPITWIGLTWTGSAHGVRLRTFDQDKKPGAWQDVVAGCPCGMKPGAMGPMSQAMVPGDGGYGYQLDVNSDAMVIEAVAINAGRFKPRVDAATGTPLPTTSPSALARTSASPSASASAKPSAAGGSRPLSFPRRGWYTGRAGAPTRRSG